MTKYVITLQPGERAAEAIASLKARVRDLVGDQQYLDDEPHVTLYVGDLDVDPGSDIDLPHPDERAFDISDWKVFRNDVVTNNHTLTCKVESPGIKTYQKQIATMLAPHRREEMVERFVDAYDSFDERRQRNLSEYGFPFVGDGWIPHLTVASIRPEDFEAVWSRLQDEVPTGEYEFRSVKLYELADGALRPQVELDL
jgi:2'-5' RNA ligase